MTYDDNIIMALYLGGLFLPPYIGVGRNKDKAILNLGTVTEKKINLMVKDSDYTKKVFEAAFKKHKKRIMAFVD